MKVLNVSQPQFLLQTRDKKYLLHKIVRKSKCKNKTTMSVASLPTFTYGKITSKLMSSCLPPETNKLTGLASRCAFSINH